DVIFGHAKDDELGDKINVTVIATGFSSTPLTGFEKAPKRNVTTLEEEKAVEIKTPMDSPTQKNPWAGAKEVQAEDEPFLKSEVEEPAADSWNVEPVAATPTEEPQKEMNFDWEAKKAEAPVERKVEEEVKRYVLEDDMDDVDLDATAAPVKKALTAEEQQRRSQERLARIQQYTQKLKKADGIQEFENEPAYVRRNVQLDESTPSNEDNSSRFSVSKDENGTSLNGNNSFLHDNVD
ncbi:MAG: cell division protein FtsZ, partial [Crocinitomicaceae bacterium]